MKKLYTFFAVLLLSSPLFAQQPFLFGGLYVLPDNQEVIMVQCDAKDGMISAVYHAPKGGKYLRYEIMRQEDKPTANKMPQKALRLYHEKAPNVVYEMTLTHTGKDKCTLQFNTLRQNNQRTLVRLAQEDNMSFDNEDPATATMATAMQSVRMQFYDPTHDVYADNIPIAFGVMEDPIMFELAIGEGEQRAVFYCAFDKDLTVLMGNDNVMYTQKEFIGKLSLLKDKRWMLSLFDKKGNALGTLAEPK